MTVSSRRLGIDEIDVNRNVGDGGPGKPDASEWLTLADLQAMSTSMAQRRGAKSDGTINS